MLRARVGAATTRGGSRHGRLLQPLHNDLDPMRWHAIGSLLNNLFGKSKSRSGSRHTDLPARDLTATHHRCSTRRSRRSTGIIEDELIRRTSRRSRRSSITHLTSLRASVTRGSLRHPGRCGCRWATRTWVTMKRVGRLPGEPRHSFQCAPDLRRSADRRHRFEAIQRWFFNTWTRLDPKVKASIVEGVVVFCRSSTRTPAVHRAFCPPREASSRHQSPAIPDRCRHWKTCWKQAILGLNFPSPNPALARARVMLKLDFQRAVLQRIPKSRPTHLRVARHPLRGRRIHARHGGNRPDCDERLCVVPAG